MPRSRRESRLRFPGEAAMHLAHDALAIDEIAAGHRLHVEGLGRRVLGIGHEREGHGDLLQEFLRVVDGDFLVHADHDEAARAVLAIQRIEHGERDAARRAPRRPEIHVDDLALEAARRERLRRSLDRGTERSGIGAPASTARTDCEMRSESAAARRRIRRLPLDLLDHLRAVYGHREVGLVLAREDDRRVPDVRGGAAAKGRFTAVPVTRYTRAAEIGRGVHVPPGTTYHIGRCPARR